MNSIKDFSFLVLNTLQALAQRPFRWRETLAQFTFVANGSLGIIVICVSFAAVVTILESSFHMKLVIQNDSMVPGFAALLILRELGAVVTALLLTSRVGAGFAAEVGTMQITEQVDALKMLGIDPIQFLVLPRLLATIVGTAVLVVIANIVCILCSMLVSRLYLGFTPGLFLTSMQRFVEYKDMLFSVIKGACFGATIPLISCFFGFRCKPGADGVGRATTQSVVFASIAIIIIDFILSYVFSYLY